MMGAIASLSTLLLLCACLPAYTAPWDLDSYERCKQIRLRGIDAEASGVTYSYVTNSLWVVTRRPRVLAEYTVRGNLVRTIDTLNAKLRDPEGVTWMYDYVFAISEEGGSPRGDDSSITIVEAAPWRSEVDVLKKIYIRGIRHDKNKGLEGLSWDPLNQVLYASQEFDPVQIWAIDPFSGRSQKVFNDAERNSRLRDFASVYKRAGDPGIYILSEPTKMAMKLDKDGDATGESKRVHGPMPEGLTFTSDGHMMFVVSEPNIMFTYSSTGSCDYNPKTAPNWELSSGDDGDDDDDDDDDDDSSSEDPEMPLITKGYCSFDECGSGSPQGTTWCRANIHHCVGGCSGWWCSATQGIPPITKHNYVGPPPPPNPPPQNPPPPTPWYTADSKGFCATTGDCSSKHEDPWCRDSAVNCMKCAAAWCPKPDAGAAVPLTRDNYPDVLPGQPWYYLPSLGFCSSTSDCSMVHSDAWCADTALNCVKCGSTWCPRGDLKKKPITFETYPNVPARSPPPSPPMSPPPPPWYKSDSKGFCASTGDCSTLHDDPWCRDSAVNCMKCAATWCPRPNVKAAEPLTRDNYPDILPGQPWYYLPSLGFCSSKSDCSMAHSDGWCADSALNCVKCASTWCPQKGLNRKPITFDTYPNAPARSPPPPPPMNPPPPTPPAPPPPPPSPSPPSPISTPSPMSTPTPPGVLPSPGPGDEQTDTPFPTWWDYLEEAEEDHEGHKAILRLGMMGIGPLDEQQTRTMGQVVALTAFGAEDAEVRVQIFPAPNAMYDHHTVMIEQEVTILAETESHASYVVAKLSNAVESGSLMDALNFPGLAEIQILDSQVALAGIPARDFPKSVQSVQMQSAPEEIFTFEVDDLLPASPQDAPWIVIIASVSGGIVIGVLVVALFALKKRRRGSASSSTTDNAQIDSEEAKTSMDTSLSEMPSPSEVQLRDMPLHEIREGVPSCPSMDAIPRVPAPQKHAAAGGLGRHNRNGSASCLLEFQGGFSSAESTPRHSRNPTMEDFPAQDLSEIVLAVTGSSDVTPAEQ